MSVVSREEQADLEHCVLNTLITGLSELSSLERSTCYQKKKKCKMTDWRAQQGFEVGLS